MTREKQIEQSGRVYSKDCVALKFPTHRKALMESDIIAAYRNGAEWADNNPDKRNVYTKDELLKMGFGFDLNGNIVTPKEEEKMTKKYFEYKKKQWLDKACEWLKEQEEMIGISFQEDFIIRFREALKGE